MSNASNALRHDKFFVEKSTFGGITILKLNGTLNEEFDGKKLASSIRTTKLVLNTRDVRRFASWGMAEWMTFMRETAELDLYIVEGSTYSVSQLNLITGLMGHAKLTSFYTSYRCSSCNSVNDALFVVPRDRAILRDIPSSQHVCASCGGRAFLEEYPAAFFEAIASRPAFDIDDEVLQYLRSRLKYDLSPDLTRFRAFRRVHKDAAYIRMSGNIATLPPDTIANASAKTTIVDLHGIVFETDQLANWQTYVKTATSRQTSLQLLGCPPGFLGTAVQLADLQDKLSVRTFMLALRCGTCDTPNIQQVDVAPNLEQLVQGMVPSTACPSCRTILTADPHGELLAVLRALPARGLDVALDGFLAKALREPLDKLENCLAVAPAKAAAAPGRPSTRVVYVALVLGVLMLAALAVVAVELWRQPAVTGQAAAIPTPSGEPAQKATFTRPEWIMSDVPSSAYCQDMINRIMCIGVSGYRASRDDAVTEATDAALDEFVNLVGLKVTDSVFREVIMPGYSTTRAKALSALQVADLDKPNDTKAAAAADEVRKARKRVVEILQASGGAAVPAQRSDWYWEEYAAEHGKSNEFLVFVRYDVPLDAVRVLVEKYSATTPVLGSSAMTAFPALAWKHANFVGGALLTKVGAPLGSTGIEPMQIVSAVGDERVTDAPGFARRFNDSPPGEIKLKVEIGDAPGKVISVRK